MTTVAFAPVTQGAPPFQSALTLDGATSILAAWWNVYAQRWYITLTDQSENVQWTGPLVGGVQLAPGVFQTSTLTYDSTAQAFTVTP